MPNTVKALSKLTRKVLYYLSDNATQTVNGEREIIISLNGIAEAVPCSQRTARRSVRRLETLGYITTYLRVQDIGGFTDSRYVIHPITAEFAEEAVRRHIEEVAVPITPLRMADPVKPR